LYLTVPTAQIDINIHPTKTEVKFENEQALYAIIRSTIKHSLGQYHVAPVLDFERNASLDVPYDYTNKLAGTPKINVDADFNPFKENYPKRQDTSNWEDLYKTQSFESRDIDAEPITGNLFDGREKIEAQVCMQIRKTYILSAIKSGLVLIDQNLAHQRILYEEFLTKITLEESASQQLLFPLNLSLNTQDVALLKNLISDFESIGFIFEFKNADEIVVKGMPLTVKESQVQSLIESLLDAIQNQTKDSNYSQSDCISKSLARSLAIKKGMSLSTKEQEELLNNLFSCKEPSVSPQGKATFITLSLEDIEKKFNTF
jgi:DNA mismatch repair protein MutL